MENESLNKEKQNRKELRQRVLNEQGIPGLIMLILESIALFLMS